MANASVGKNLSVVIRVDANSSIGGGHLSRCSHLAVAFIKKNIDVHFLVSDKACQSRLPSGCHCHVLKKPAATLAECDEAMTYASKIGATWFILDGYHFNSAYREQVSKHNYLVCFDDQNNSGDLHANAVVNSYALANNLHYSQTADKAQCLLGTAYTLLAEQFLAVEKKPYINRNHWLICFGAADVGNRTQSILLQLANNLPADVIVDVVCGGFCQSHSEIEALCKKQGYHFYYDYQQMAPLMQQAALAIAAPGSMLYELAYSEVPSLFCISAANQRLNAAFHERLGWCKAYESTVDDVSIINDAVALWLDRVRRVTMASIAAKQIDGQGAQRIVEQLLVGRDH